MSDITMIGKRCERDICVLCMWLILVWLVYSLCVYVMSHVAMVGMRYVWLVMCGCCMWKHKRSSSNTLAE